MHDRLLLRRLQNGLETVPVIKIEKQDWDTDEGINFLRDVMQAHFNNGLSYEELGEALGIPDLKYVVKARERSL